MVKSIVTNIKELNRPCLNVEKDENIKEIIQDLKDTLNTFSHKAVGLSANQIGYNKKISYIRIPISQDAETKQWKYKEFYLINAKIIEKTRPIQVKNESCLSFSGMRLTTRRYVFIIAQYLNEELKEHTTMFQDFEGLVIQHEVDHQNSLTIFNRKWRAL